MSRCTQRQVLARGVGSLNGGRNRRPRENNRGHKDYPGTCILMNNPNDDTANDTAHRHNDREYEERRTRCHSQTCTI